MKIYLSQFVYSARMGCFVAEAHVKDVYFAVVVCPMDRTVELCALKGGKSIKEVRKALSPYDDMLMDYVAEQFGWEAA